MPSFLMGLRRVDASNSKTSAAPPLPAIRPSPSFGPLENTKNENFTPRTEKLKSPELGCVRYQPREILDSPIKRASHRFLPRSIKLFACGPVHLGKPFAINSPIGHETF